MRHTLGVIIPAAVSALCAAVLVWATPAVAASKDHTLLSCRTVQDKWAININVLPDGTATSEVREAGQKTVSASSIEEFTFMPGAVVPTISLSLKITSCSPGLGEALARSTSSAQSLRIRFYDVPPEMDRTQARLKLVSYLQPTDCDLTVFRYSELEKLHEHWSKMRR